MKILYINKFFDMRGGVDRYFFDLAHLMERKGHKIAFFSSKSDKNIRSKWKKYFVDFFPYDDKKIISRIKFVFNIFYSIEARNKIRKLLDEFQPDIVHIHSIFHHISPSILPEIKKRDIPIVQNLGDYHLVAPNYTLFHNGKICEITKPNKYYKALFHKCVKNSYLATLLEVFEKYFHKWLGWERNYIDYFIVPSRFMKKKLKEFGLDTKKIFVLPHFTDYRLFKPNYNNGQYILYFGRLSEEKGLMTLLEIMKRLPQINLKIAGRGFQEKQLKDKVKNESIKNVEFLGYLEGESLRDTIRKCRFSILPSLWYEVFGLSIIESMALGKPVIAAKIGGITEIIKENYNGLFFEAGNKSDCKDKILKLWNEKSFWSELSKNARKTVIEKYNSEDHYLRLIKIYNCVSFNSSTFVI